LVERIKGERWQEKKKRAIGMQKETPAGDVGIRIRGGEHEILKDPKKEVSKKETHTS